MFTAMNHAQQLQELEELQHNLAEAQIRNADSDLRITQLEAELQNLHLTMTTQTRMAQIRNADSDFRIAQLKEELENLNRTMRTQTRMFALERIALQAAQDEIAALKQTLNREGIWESLHQRIEQLQAENKQLRRQMTP
jgi:peptidyl-tRNA hydrolase